MVRSKIEAGKLQMDKKELVANSWIFVSSVHRSKPCLIEAHSYSPVMVRIVTCLVDISEPWLLETTASTLLVTMTMLALHPHIQEEVYQSVLSITRERDMVRANLSFL
jgi:hypothetical protein